MGGKSFISLAIIAALCLSVAPIFLAPAHSQEDIVELTGDEFINKQRPPAVFKHDAHNSAAELEDKCYVCHHEDGANISEDADSSGTPCVDCHAVTPDDDTTGLLDAFHKQCKGCHEQQNKGPVACGECHVRK